MHVLDIIGQPGDKTARGLFLKKFHSLPEQMAEKGHPQPVHEILSQPLKQHHLAKSGHKGDNDHDAIGNGKMANPLHPQRLGKIAGPHETIYAELQQGRHGQGGAGQDQGKQQRDNKAGQHGAAERVYPLPYPQVKQAGGPALLCVAEITHGPAFGILDLCWHGGHVGCKDLLQTVQRIQPKIHACGHIHEAYGIEEQGNTTFVNACSIAIVHARDIERSNPPKNNPPIVLDV
jgi:hypothetical protein